MITLLWDPFCTEVDFAYETCLLDMLCCHRKCVCLKHSYKLTDSLRRNFTRYGHCLHHDQSHWQMKQHNIPWSPVILWLSESQLGCAFLCVRALVCEYVVSIYVRERETEKQIEMTRRTWVYTTAMIITFYRSLLSLIAKQSVVDSCVSRYQIVLYMF